MSTSVVTIEELTGKKRRLELRGTGVPIKPAGFPGETTLATQWYPGNKRASQQVLSPKLMPSDWSGSWRTTLLLRDPCQWTETDGGSPVSVAYPYSLWEIMESLREEGQLLRVTWTNQSAAPTGNTTITVPQRQFKVVRIGRISTFEPRPDTLDDVAWSITFVWIGKGETQPAQIQSVSQDLVAELQRAINSQTGVEAAVNTALKAPPTRFTLGTLEQMTGAPLAMFDSFALAAKDVTSRMRDLGDVILKTRDIPATLIGRALDVANYAVSASNNFMDQISRTSIESMTNRSKVTMLTRAASYYSGGMTQAQLMADINTDIAQTAAKRRNALHPASSASTRVNTGDVISVYIPRQGDTMGKIAAKFYGTDSVADSLARANGISGYAISPPVGVPLVIPTKAVLDSLSNRTQ